MGFFKLFKVVFFFLFAFFFFPGAGLELPQNPQLGLLSLILQKTKIDLGLFPWRQWMGVKGQGTRILRNTLDFWRGFLEESQLGCPCAFPSSTLLVGPHQWQDPPAHSHILHNSGVSFSPPAWCGEEFGMSQSEFSARPNSPASRSPCPANVPRTFLQGIESCVILLARAKKLLKLCQGLAGRGSRIPRKG